MTPRIFLALIITAQMTCAAAEYPVKVLDEVPHATKDSPTQYIISVAGTRCRTIDEFKEVVLQLPPGSKITWEVGCFSYLSIPLGPAPQMSKRDFQNFCHQHGVTFVMTKYTSY